jgi:hypothetical protein
MEDFAKLLAGGVGSWLQYEHACGHSELFSEKYLTQPIGHILSGRTGKRARAEFTHKVLADRMKGPGRRPAVDFVVSENYPKVSIGVESKWIGKSDVSVESIVWDLVWLELLCHYDGARCFFVLGGRAKGLRKRFADPAFAKGSTNRSRKPFLRHNINAIHPIRIGPTDTKKLGLLNTVYRKYPDLDFPAEIITRRTAPFPKNQTSNGFQVYVWVNRPGFAGGCFV